MSVNFSKIGSALLSIAENAPSFIGPAATILTDVISIYQEVKTELSATQVTAIDAALAQSQTDDANATASADAALDAASKQ